MLKLAIALALTAAAPATIRLGEPVGDISQWIRGSDLALAGGGGAVRFETLFDEDGNPDTCGIVASTGNQAIEKLVCVLAFKRFKFEPSLNSDGKPVYRLLQRAAFFAPITKASADITTGSVYSLKVKGIKKSDPRFFVLVDVGDDGTLKGCSKIAFNRDKLALTDTVCRAIANIWQSAPRRNSAGLPVRYLRDLSVELKAE